MLIVKNSKSPPKKADLNASLKGKLQGGAAAQSHIYTTHSWMKSKKY